MPVKALIDGDIVVYRSAFAAEHTSYELFVPTVGASRDPNEPFNPEHWERVAEFESAKELKEYVKEHGITDYTMNPKHSVEPVENALYSVKHTIKSICEALKTTDYVVELSGPSEDCFRHDMSTTVKYKGNREDQKRPVHYQACRDYLIEHHKAHINPVIEADDALALGQGEDTVICSIDKDLQQIPGKHYNWVTGNKVNVSKRAGLCRLWEQVLMGDSTDNIPGIKGIGTVKAKKLIGDCKSAIEMEDLCVREWDKALKEGKVQKIALTSYKNGLVHYTDKDGNPRIKTLRDLVNEVHGLLLIGGKYAEEALNEVQS